MCCPEKRDHSFYFRGQVEVLLVLDIFMGEETHKCPNHILVLSFLLSLKFLRRLHIRTMTDWNKIKEKH